MTFAEVIDEIDAFNRRHEANVKERKQLRAEMDYQLAQLVGVIINDPKKYPRSLAEAYPTLFKQDWHENKSHFQNFADEFNRRREAGASDR